MFHLIIVRLNFVHQYRLVLLFIFTIFISFHYHFIFVILIELEREAKVRAQFRPISLALTNNDSLIAQPNPSLISSFFRAHFWSWRGLLFFLSFSSLTRPTNATAQHIPFLPCTSHMHGLPYAWLSALQTLQQSQPARSAPAALNSAMFQPSR